MPLFLYQLHSSMSGYDTYDTAVVVAPDADTARRMHPSDGSVQGKPDPRSHEFNSWGERWNHFEGTAEQHYRPSGTWPASFEEVSVSLIGLAEPHLEQGVRCASFRAG